MLMLLLVALVVDIVVVDEVELVALALLVHVAVVGAGLVAMPESVN